jgi:hypothetical protein
LTEVAQKYTHPTGDRQLELEGIEPLKSGLSPLELASFTTIDEYLTYWSLEEYQINRFAGLLFALSAPLSYVTNDLVLGFTTAELVNLEAFAPDRKHAVDLTMNNMPIHPMYAQENWVTCSLLHNPGYLIGDGSQGYYEVRTWAST